MRTSRKLLALKIARQQREGELFDAAAGEEPAEIVWRELRPIFDDELGRMPDKLRLPAVLCFLEGLSKSEAARVLGWPEGTVSGRLQRARERLRLRFLARGLTLSAGALAIAFFEGAGTAAIPERLFESTLRLAANVPLTSTVQTVANGVIQTMFIAKAKAVAAGVLAIGIIGTGTGMVLVPGSGPGEVVAAETPAEQSGKKAATSPDTGKAQTPPAISPERAVREQDLALLKERLEWEQRMVAKGYMNKSQLSKTETEIARAEELLAKASPPRATKVPDPQQEAYNALIQTLETIVQRTEEGFKKGIVPEVELLNARATLLRYKLEYTKLAESTRDRPDAELRKALIAQKERELVRAEALYKQKAISAEEVRRAHVSLNQFRAEAADASGEYAAAVRCREAVSMDLQALARK